MFDAEDIRRVSRALQIRESQVEKECHLIRALGVIGSVHVDGVAAAFSGGTSLSTAWQLIRRFSEDIDFKVAVKGQTASAQRALRRKHRQAILDALEAAEFVLDDNPLVGNEGIFFRASFRYGPIFPKAARTSGRHTGRDDIRWHTLAAPTAPGPVPAFANAR